MKASPDTIAPPDAASGPVELVTLHAERIADGQLATDALQFPDIASALRHARTMSGEQRSVSWLRCGDGVRTLDEAEATPPATPMEQKK